MTGPKNEAEERNTPDPNGPSAISTDHFYQLVADNSDSLLAWDRYRSVRSGVLRQKVEEMEASSSIRPGTHFTGTMKALKRNDQEEAITGS